MALVRKLERDKREFAVPEDDASKRFRIPRDDAFALFVSNQTYASVGGTPNAAQMADVLEHYVKYGIVKLPSLPRERL